MMSDSKDSSSRLDSIKYYTSMFLGSLCIVCVFGFLFLVPFILDPAISTLMHEFIEQPVHCKVGQDHPLTVLNVTPFLPPAGDEL